jgi:uncharacterized membrane protein
MRTEPKAFVLMIVCTFLTSIAQILYKIGADKLVYDIMGLLKNYQLFLGLFLYIVAGVILIIALKDGEVSVLYPIVATSYVWVSLLSIFIIGESMNLLKWVGVFIIIAGVVFIGLGTKKDGINYTEVV